LKEGSKTASSISHKEFYMPPSLCDARES
jgi:hypothetical protein